MSAKSEFARASRLAADGIGMGSNVARSQPYPNLPHHIAAFRLSLLGIFKPPRATLILILAACAAEESAQQAPQAGEAIQVRFVDVARQVGLDYVNVSGPARGPARYILETQSAGTAFIDYDGDGFQDLFVVNGTRTDEDPPEATNRLFRNVAGAEGGRAFLEVTEAAGLLRGGWGMGCAVGDYDNDGDVDLYVTYWGPNLLYRNEGDGRFTEVGSEAGVDGSGWGSSAAFGDVDADGFLDLYATNYLEFDPRDPPGADKPCYYKGIAVYCGPENVPGQADEIYRNAGSGTFVDMGAFTGVGQHRYPGLGVVFGDFDNDGDQDIYVANDGEANQLYRNDGDWHLEEVGAMTGSAYTENGETQAGMGVHSGDYDNDGDLDLFVTNFSDDVNTLYQNLGDGIFADATHRAGLGGIARPYLGWGTAFFDFDNDGWLDLFVANGHVYQQLAGRSGGLSYAQRNLLYRNERGRFVEVGREMGQGWLIEKVSRGVAVGDFDNDGDWDLMVANINDGPTLLHNQGGNRHSWLGLELVGEQSNRDAVGARVKVVAGDLVQLREVQRGYGFQSQHDPRLIFGLEERDRVERVEIRWPSGRMQTLEEPPLRRYLTIREGSDHIAVGPEVPPGSALPEGGAAEVTREAVSVDVLGHGPQQSAEAYREVGKEHYQEGRYREAAAAFQQALKLDPDLLQARVNLAVVLHAGLGRTEAAAALLEEALRLEPSRVDAHFLLGRVYLTCDRVDRAILMLRRTVDLSPNSWEAHYWLGLAFMRADSLTAAAASLGSASRWGPWMPGPHLSLGHLLDRLGRSLEAQAEYEVFQRLRQLERRVELYRGKLKLDPKDLAAMEALGFAYLEQGRLQEAASRFQRTVRLDPDFARGYCGLAQVFAAGGNWPAAVEAYEHATRMQPDLSMAWMGLGAASYRIGQGEEAIAAYEQALALDAETPEALASLGEVYSGLERDEEAIAVWSQLLLQNPRHPQAGTWIARSRERLAGK